MRRLALCFLLAAGAAYPQLLSFGVKGGAPVTALGQSKFGFDNGNWVLGPTVELHLPFRLSVEFDALYRSLDLTNVNAPTRGGSVWEFPLLGKYRFHDGLVSPFVDAGLAFNRIGGLDLSGVKKSSAAGFVLGAGLEGKLLFIRLTPELRYTRWTSQTLQNSVTGLNFSNQNQVEALVGITF